MSHKNLARQALPGNCRLQVRRSQPGCASQGFMAVCQAVGRIPAQFQRNRRNSAQTARNRRKRRDSAQSVQFGALGAIRFGAFQRIRRIPAHSAQSSAWPATATEPARTEIIFLSSFSLYYHSIFSSPLPLPYTRGGRGDRY